MKNHKFLKGSLFIMLLFFMQHGLSQPVINSLNPSSGPAGTAIQITGASFSANPTENTVYFGAVRAQVNAASTNSLTVMVPKGSTYQPVSVTVNGLTGYSTQPFNVTFTGLETTIGPVSFAAGTELGSAFVGSDISVADFDGDGKPDIAIANSGAVNSVKIFRNTNIDHELVSFAPEMILPTQTSPKTVTIGDLDGDGRIDLVVLDQTASLISIYLNTSIPGNISFAPRINISESFTSQATIADLNADGKPELIVTIGAADKMGIYQNSSGIGNISFEPKIEISTGDGPGNIAVNDLDGDNKPDIILSNSLASNISVFKNNSTGNSISFNAKVDFTTGNEPAGIAVGDLDGDGKPDIAVANYATASSSISLLKNTSSGGNISFAAKQDRVVLNSPSSLAITDLNGDGKPDIAVANYGNKVSVFENNSIVGNLSVASRIDYTANSGGGYAFIAIADFTGDEKPDLAVVNGFILSVQRNKLSEPNITFFNPNNGYVGTPVTITGSNFTGSSAVYFGAFNAQSFTVQSPTSILAYVGQGGSGNVSVTNAYGTGTIAGFTYNYPVEVRLCPPTASTTLLSSLSGSSYQWQLSVDSMNYSNIGNGGYYSGAVTRFLTLNNIPSSFYGYRYRCLVDGNYSIIQTIRFVNTWTGSSSADWENPANWSCGKVPDSNTDVTINSGPVNISSNVIIRNLSIATGVNFTVGSGFNLTITH